MTEEELKNIKAPDEVEIDAKRKRFNTAMFSIVGNIVFLATSFGIACIFIFLFSKSFANQLTSMNYYIQQLVALWIPVAIGLACGFAIQHGLTFLIIHGFKLRDKLEESFVSHYVKKNK